MDANLKTHYTAAELAALRLTGLPASERGVRKAAERENWPSRPRARGKGREYIPPATALAELRDRSLQTCASRLALPLPHPPAGTAPDTRAQQLKADARRGVLQALDILMQRTGYPLKRAAAALLVLAHAPDASPQLVAMLRLARDERGRPSPDGLPSLRSVLRFAEYQRAGNLAPKRRQRDMYIPDWAPAFLVHYQRPEKPTVEHAYRQFCADRTPAGQNQPSIWQVRRFLAKVGQVSREHGRLGAHELKSLKPFIRRGFAHLQPGDIYSADGHTFDAEVQHPLHGRPFRPEITTVIDIATRRVVGWSVDLAESAHAVLDALRNASLAHGIPAVFYVDNGSGYCNALMKDEATGLMARLGIEMLHSLPYNSQARGVIERLHRTLWVPAAKNLPGYLGRDMDREARLAHFRHSRRALRTPGRTTALPLLGWPQFLAYCAGQVADYNRRPHSSLGKCTDPHTGRRRHQSPDERWASHEANGFTAHRIDDDEVRPLFRPQLLRTVRRGELELFGNRYFNAALEEFHGEQLPVGYDIHDPATVWVHDDDGRFICTASLNANLRDYLPQSVVERARERRADGRERRLQARLDEVRAERHGRPAILAVADECLPWPCAPDPLLPPGPVATLPAGWQVPATPAARWAEWQRQAGLDPAALPDDKARRWHDTYQATAEFRTYQRRHA